jgi:hypothetical protein
MTRRFAKAAQAYEDFSGHKPTRVTRTRIQHDDAAGWKLGPTVGIAYEARRDGQVAQYFHEFAKSARPDLVSRDDGKQLFLTGGKYTVTDHGIEDVPELFVVNPSPRRAAAPKRKAKAMRAKRNRKGQFLKNPARRSAAPKRRRTRRASQVAIFRGNPVRRRRAKSAAPARRRYRRNPSGRGLGFGKMLIPAVGVAGGAVGSELLMGYLPIPAAWKSGVMRHVTKGAIGVAAGYALSKFLKQKKAGFYVAAGALVIAVHDAAKEFIANTLPALPQGGFGQYVMPPGSQFAGMGYVSPAAVARFGEYVAPLQFNGASQAYDAPGGETDFRA